MEEQDRGPPVRPVCGAFESNNGPLSDLLSQIITQLGDEMDTTIKTLCLSTEEMCGGLEKVNAMIGAKRLTVFSMDVVKLYPSLVAEEMARMVKEEYLQAKLEVLVDDTELGLGLAILVSREELVRLGLGEVTCRRKRRGGRPILITTNWVVGERGGAADNLFSDPERTSTPEERRLMVAMWLELMVLQVMGKHVYSFNGTNRLQLLGGPVGLKLSGALAKICMMSWSRMFMAKLTLAFTAITYFQLYVLQLYVDDTGVVVEELGPGCR